MRRRLPFLTAALCLLAASAAMPQEVLLEEDFEQPTLGPGWDIEGGLLDLESQTGRDGTGRALRVFGPFRRSFGRISRLVPLDTQSPGSPKTAEVWFRLHAVSAFSDPYGEIEVLRLTDGRSATTVWDRAEIAYVGIDAGHRLFLRLGAAAKMRFDLGPWGDRFRRDTWHRIVVTYEPALPRLELAIDGGRVAELTEAGLLGALDGRIGGVGYVGMGACTADVAFDDLRVSQPSTQRGPVVSLPPSYEFRTTPDDLRGEAWTSLLGTVEAARGGLLTCTWSEAGRVLEESGAVPVNGLAEVPFTGFMTVGRHVIDLHVAEQGAGEGSARTVVTVVDATPPKLWVGVSAGMLWPPNHKMVEIIPAIVVTDNADDAPRVELISVTSSEPDDAPGAGDGATTGDIAIGSNGSISLRAERDGRGPGRTYTLRYAATDAAGNRTLAEATVTVPHDMR